MNKCLDLLHKKVLLNQNRRTLQYSYHTFEQSTNKRYKLLMANGWKNIVFMHFNYQMTHFNCIFDTFKVFLYAFKKHMCSNVTNYASFFHTFWGVICPCLQFAFLFFWLKRFYIQLGIYLQSFIFPNWIWIEEIWER